MTTFVQVLAKSPWRLQVLVDSPFGGSGTPGSYTIARADGIATTVAVGTVVPLDTITFGLALLTPLTEDVIYTLAASGVTGLQAFSFQQPVPQASGQAPIDDPEAEAFGLDIDWLGDGLVGGDMPVIRGVECLRQDLVAIGITRPGELFHRKDSGAGLPDMVNGTADTGALAAALKREWLKDSRVKSANPKVTINTSGEVQARDNVVPNAINIQLPVQVP